MRANSKRHLLLSKVKVANNFPLRSQRRKVTANEAEKLLERRLDMKGRKPGLNFFPWEVMDRKADPLPTTPCPLSPFAG